MAKILKTIRHIDKETGMYYFKSVEIDKEDNVIKTRKVEDTSILESKNGEIKKVEIEVPVIEEDIIADADELDGLDDVDELDDIVDEMVDDTKDNRFDDTKDTKNNKNKRSR